MAVAEKTAQSALTTYPDYSRLIENLTADLNEAKTDLRAARDDGLRYRAQIRVSELTRAIENAQAAEQIEAERVGETWIAKAVQFGFPGKKGLVPMPPNVEEFAAIFPPIRYDHHRYLATDPLEIACLRRAMANGAAIEEVPVGSVYAKPVDGSPDGTWMPYDMYQQLQRTGAVR